MSLTERKNERLLIVLQFLRQEASPEHPLPMRRILLALKRRGIVCARKAVGRDIAALRRFGYPIVFTRTPYAGYYLTSRALNTAEVRILIDAVDAAPFLTADMTEQLTEKLQTLVNRRERAALQKQIYYDPSCKQQNTEICCSIDVLHRAIAQGRKVSFWYYHRTLKNNHIQLNDGRQFVLSPYALFWKNDHYYLAGNYEKYNTVGNYRLDRMYKAKMLKKPVRPFSEVTPYRERFDTADYLHSAFYLYGGKVEQLLLRCDSSLLDVLTDRFGSEAEVLESSGETFTTHVQVRVSEGLYEWLLQCGARLTVLSPTYVRDEMRHRIRDLYSLYRLAVPEEGGEEEPPQETDS
ncbi:MULTISPECIES: helix-turn-helix transcriptional regulator [Caproicibacterium]|jgi:predicted DNA-binding transcriptional regulator YafY|uniref:WYL domain-containing protein n=1 Tax=Caproicibacterium lactatifermentans TaxID=2666138 RepID=A0A859DSH2_9FIRM|nr:WYL domain-containing protein [Caproicibacterium lactatifermentans]ARP50527.1 hypothetical protein B6259_06345 [Ruminococcaceae bacterium CPB6]MDD4807371.1 WYL domain-containing protein [Oscillospiraceae bacterium]QKN23752.1 WYL domain-containing protein [Caproicibacterium lactatifermentans]QKO29613.1 WYL domain-containing protein [Caproicibacterium lactatifermentans]